jgi:hypothetical protein
MGVRKRSPAIKGGDSQVTQSGAIFSVALRRFADEWRIAAWAWAKGKTSITSMPPVRDSILQTDTKTFPPSRL